MRLDGGFAGTVLVGVEGDERGRILRVDRALVALLEGSSTQIVGSELAEHLHADDRPTMGAALAEVAREGAGSYEGMVRLLASDGSVRAALVHASRVGYGARPAVIVRILDRSAEDRKPAPDASA
ncbi:MAG: PAS domain-containing protein [Solirubrobacteraceae bacterium]|jgi:PAS domain-containing protein